MEGQRFVRRERQQFAEAAFDVEVVSCVPGHHVSLLSSGLRQRRKRNVLQMWLGAPITDGKLKERPEAYR
jgi:hypothetical protein